MSRAIPGAFCSAWEASVSDLPGFEVPLKDQQPYHLDFDYTYYGCRYHWMLVAALRVSAKRKCRLRPD